MFICITQTFDLQMSKKSRRHHNLPQEQHENEASVLHINDPIDYQGGIAYIILNPLFLLLLLVTLCHATFIKNHISHHTSNICTTPSRCFPPPPLPLLTYT